jgi:hypothetical protein
MITAKPVTAAVVTTELAMATLIAWTILASCPHREESRAAKDPPSNRTWSDDPSSGKTSRPARSGAGRSLHANPEASRPLRRD